MSRAKIAGGVIGALGVVGLLVTSSITKVDTKIDPKIEPIETEIRAIYFGELDVYRPAITLSDCPLEGEPGYVYMIEQCQHWRNEKDHCICTTLNPEQLISEVLPENISDGHKRKCGAVRYTLDSVQYYTEGCYPLGWVPPPGSTGIQSFVIMDGGSPKKYMITTVQSAVRTELIKDLETECSPCVITPGNWGSCPKCRLDNNCATVCAEE